MCDFIAAPILAAFKTGGAATAAGATAGAATAGSSLATLGTIVSVGGTLASAYGQNRAAKGTAQEIENQKATERRISAVEDQRGRRRFMSAIRRQAGELMARGVALDSPTAIALGQTAAQEASYDSQAIRAGSDARQAELTSEQRSLRARGRNALFKGGFSAAGTVLDDAPDLWPELYA